jgi:hypothetical protein
MSKYETKICPREHCDGEVEIEHGREEHKVHNGLAMQTVAVDYWSEIVDGTCDCEYTEDELEYLLE